MEYGVLTIHFTRCSHQIFSWIYLIKSFLLFTNMNNCYILLLTSNGIEIL
jgi:hypothetical protein